MRELAGKLVAVAVGAVALVLASGGVSLAAQVAQSGTGVLVPSSPGATLPLQGGSTDSLNWSGYAVTPASGITAVSSTFTVPKAGILPPGFAATWTGIGGYNTADLIQAGTAEQSLPSLPLVGDHYYAWYELLPNSEVQLSGCAGDPKCTVTPGDRISVGIRQIGSGEWSIAMTDAGKWSWSSDVSYGSSESSAEWILEAPTLVVQTLPAPVGTVAFGPTSTYTAGGVTRTIAQGHPTKIDLSPGLINLYAPSALAPDGQSFDVCAYALSCAAP